MASESFPATRSGDALTTIDQEQQRRDQDADERPPSRMPAAEIPHQQLICDADAQHQPEPQLIPYCPSPAFVSSSLDLIGACEQLPLIDTS
jgi:hypothetical protein